MFEDEVKASMEMFSKVIALELEPMVTGKTLVCELLLYHQQRYINSIYGGWNGEDIRREKDHTER